MALLGFEALFHLGKLCQVDFSNRARSISIWELGVNASLTSILFFSKLSSVSFLFCVLRCVLSSWFWRKMPVRKQGESLLRNSCGYPLLFSVLCLLCFNRCLCNWWDSTALALLLRESKPQSFRRWKHLNVCQTFFPWHLWTREAINFFPRWNVCLKSLCWRFNILSFLVNPFVNECGILAKNY